MTDRITISISRTTYKRLTDNRKYGETMDGIINSLLDDTLKITKSSQLTGGKK